MAHVNKIFPVFMKISEAKQGNLLLTGVAYEIWNLKSISVQKQRK